MMPAKWIQEIRPALIAVGFLQMAGHLLGPPLSFHTRSAIFFAAFSVYLADHFFRSLWPLLVITSGAFLWTGYRADPLRWPVIAGYILLAFAYVFPLFPGKKRLQDFPWARVVAVVGGWALIPFILKDFSFSTLRLLYVLGIAATMIPALIWSDLADAKQDQEEGRLTWTMQRSKRQLTWISNGALLISCLCFSPGSLRILLPLPLLYLAFSGYLNRHPQHSDWILLWPFVGSSFF